MAKRECKLSARAREDLAQTNSSELQAQCAALKDELVTLRGARACEQQRFQSEKERAAGLDQQNHELTIRVTELQQRLSDRERHLQMLGEQNDALTRLLSRAHTERASLERRAEQLQQDLSELREHFHTKLSRLLVTSRAASGRPPGGRKTSQSKERPTPPRKAKTKASKPRRTGSPRRKRRSHS